MERGCHVHAEGRPCAKQDRATGPDIVGGQGLRAQSSVLEHWGQDGQNQRDSGNWLAACRKLWPRLVMQHNGLLPKE